MRPLTRSAWAFLFALFFILVSIMAICALPASAAGFDPGYNYNLFNLSDVTYSMRFQDDSVEMVSSTSQNAITGWFPVSPGKYYVFSTYASDVSSRLISRGQIVRVQLKMSDGSIKFYARNEYPTESSSYGVVLPVTEPDVVAMRVQIQISSVAGGASADIGSAALLSAFKPMIVSGDTLDEAIQNGLNLPYLDSTATPYTYSVVYNGAYGLTFRSFSESCTLDLIVDSEGFKISVDGYEDDYNYSASEFNSDYQQFAGLSYQGDEELADYTVGNSYEITLTPSNPILNLTSVFKHPLYVDPAGGIWNNSSDVSVIWDYFGSDYDQIYNPTREGYIFDGWTFTGSGDFSSAGDPPHSYTFRNAAGYLTAKWVGDPALQQSATITIVGAPYTFTDYGVMPSVQLTVTSTGAVMTYGSQSHTYTYPGSGAFTGFSFLANADLSLPVGQTFNLAPGSHTLFPCSDEEFQTIIKIGSETFTFSAYGSHPIVTMNITSTGCVMMSSTTGYAYTCSLDGDFLGFGATDHSSEPSWIVGDEVTITGSADKNIFQYYPFVVKEQRTAVSIGGSSYYFYADYSSPDVTVTVTDFGCSLTDGTTTHLWNFNGTGEYSGLKYNGVEYKIGSTFELYGANGLSKNYALYPVFNNDGVIQGILSGFIDFLIIPVMAFFNVEFIPGFSFGKIALIAFIIGLVFWFLKASK